MTKILITGGAGYIGSLLTEHLVNEGYQVVVIDNFMYKQTSLLNLVNRKNLEIILGDVRDSNLVSRHLSEADVVIPLAAIVGAPACARDPKTATEINKLAILKMFKAISNGQRILMPTTNSAYGTGDSDNYCDENSTLKPISLYAKDKVEVEEKLMELSGATSFRLATVFGMSPRMRLDLLVNDFVRRAIIDNYIVVFEGEFKRNYIHIKDVVLAFQHAINNPDAFIGEIFNVGLSSANISKLELCQRIKRYIPNFVIVESPLGKDPDQRNYMVSNKKIESRGFKTEYSLDEGIRELISGIPLLSTRPFTNI